jgi:hypothetical protein
VALHFMSDKELSRVEILRDLTAGRLTVSAASKMMGLDTDDVRMGAAFAPADAVVLGRWLRHPSLARL